MTKFKCPKCKGTIFNVSIYGFQKWDSDSDEWGSVEVEGISKDIDGVYYCLTCENIFNEKDALK